MRDITKLESEIRADGWHPDNPSPECVLALMPPFETLSMSTEDRLGLRTDFTVNRYMFQYLRGSLGPETSDQRVLFVKLTQQFTRSTSVDCFFDTDRGFALWFTHWYRSRMQPSNKLLDEHLYSGLRLLDLPEDRWDEYELAVVSLALTAAADCFGIDEKRYLKNLRAGQAMHTAGVGHQGELTSEDRQDAKLAVPDDPLLAIAHFAFVERGDPTLTSALNFGQRGVAPDPLRVKTNLDSFGRPLAKDDRSAPFTDDTPEPVDETATTAAEVHYRVSVMRAELTKIRAREKPDSSRWMVADSILKGDGRSLNAIAADADRAYEGVRRAYEQIAEEISRIV